MQRQTIANMESDMDRWIRDRDRLSKQLERCQKKNEERIKSGRVSGKIREGGGEQLEMQ